MTPGLILPAALAALLALAVPLAIHIARRTENRTIDFAALRWLSALSRPRRKPRIDERLLLAARLLLLALLVAGLARPVLWDAQDTSRVVAVAPGLDANAGDGDARRIWLAPGFPAVGGPTPARPSNLISLVRQLDAELPPGAPLEIVVPATLDGMDAERPRLSRRVTWRAVQGPAAAAPARTTPPELSVRYAPGSAEGVRWFRAAALAWAEPGTAPAFEAAPLDRPLAAKADALIWLAPGPLPSRIAEWVKRGGVILLSVDAVVTLEGEATPVWRNPAGEPLAVSGRMEKGRVVRLTRALDPSVLPQLVEADFPDALARMLAPPPAPARVAAADHTPLTGAGPWPQPPLDLRPWLALIAVMVFAAERFLATRRVRAAAP